MPLLIPADAAKRFRAVASKCRPTRTRDPDLLVLAQVRSGMFTLFANFGEISLAMSEPATTRPGTAVVLLTDLERTDASGLLGSGDGGTKKSDIPAMPPLPDEMQETTPVFLSALHEAGKTAARDESRYALTRIQVRGKEGKVLATDGKQALIQPGFKLPFVQDVLVPAVPVFGVKDLATQPELQVGKTDTHLVVMAGPFTVWLLIDADGRFPVVEEAIPRSRLATTLEVELPAALADTLRSLPGEDEESHPVTLDLGSKLIVRAKAGELAPVEVRVQDVSITGPPLVAVVNRKHLQRALEFGLREFRFASAERPWTATDSTRTYLATTLDPRSAIESTDRISRINSIPPVIPKEEGPVANPSNGHANGHPNGQPPTDGPDPLVEAEALKTALAEAHAQAGRLIAALRGYRKQRRTVESALASLRSLRLE